MAILIKRYANRKLYNTESSRYITLKGISELVREGRELRVIDNESGKDITPVILSQVLVDDQRHTEEDESPVPGRVLSELIQKGGDALYGLLSRSLPDVHDNLSEARENVRRLLNPNGAGSGNGADAADLSRLIHQTVERVIKVMDLPTRDEIERLNRNLERLADALERSSARPPRPSPSGLPSRMTPIRPRSEPPKP